MNNSISVAGIYSLKDNNGNFKTLCEIYSNQNIKAQDWHHYGAFFVNLEQISHIALMFPLLNLNKSMLVGAKYLQSSFPRNRVVFMALKSETKFLFSNIKKY